MAIQFTKMCGCGNDFIVIDNRQGLLGGGIAEFAQKHCARRRGIGADGILLIEASDSADFRMRTINADGSEAEMCGNGGRCVARFALARGIAPASMKFETLAGPVEAEVHAETVTIGMSGTSAVQAEKKLEVNGETVIVHAIEAGVPHAIVFTGDVDGVAVDKLGRAIRMHPFFQPRGTNADFVQVVGPGRIRMRTYERGVEGETLACGTGAIASAIVSHLRRDAGGPPIKVVARGGLLTVDFTVEDDRIRNVRLSGEAIFVYDGQFPE